MGIHSNDAVSEALTVMRELSEYLKRVHDLEGSEDSAELLYLSNSLRRLSRQQWSSHQADLAIRKKAYLQ